MATQIAQVTAGQMLYALSDEDMTRILSIAHSDAATYFNEYLSAIWKTVLGDNCFDTTAPQINCTAHAIPEAQWVKLHRNMIEKLPERHRVPAAMQFVNIGPSTYREDPRAN